MNTKNGGIEMDNNEKYKLVTRRGLAWGVGAVALGTVAFAGILGVLNGTTELVTLSLGILGTTLGSIVGFYFGKKTSEE